MGPLEAALAEPRGTRKEKESSKKSLEGGGRPVPEGFPLLSVPTLPLWVGRLEPEEGEWPYCRSPCSLGL